MPAASWISRGRRGLASLHVRRKARGFVHQPRGCGARCPRTWCAKPAAAWIRWGNVSRHRRGCRARSVQLRARYRATWRDHVPNVAREAPPLAGEVGGHAARCPLLRGGHRRMSRDTPGTLFRVGVVLNGRQIRHRRRAADGARPDGALPDAKPLGNISACKAPHERAAMAARPRWRPSSTTRTSSASTSRMLFARRRVLQRSSRPAWLPAAGARPIMRRSLRCFMCLGTL